MGTAAIKTAVVKPSPYMSYSLGFYEDWVNEKTLQSFLSQLTDIHGKTDSSLV